MPATKLFDSREVRISNFSFMNPWYVPGRGFIAFFSYYLVLVVHLEYSSVVFL